ncbi:MAG: DUF5666 domain-containing protein, partial [Actinobacteria bacterium]|nr:DUF5666 domain-containing protein [Actinomycetota bacterium]
MKYWMKIALAFAFVAATGTAAVAFTSSGGGTSGTGSDGSSLVAQEQTPKPDARGHHRFGRFGRGLGKRVVTGEFKVQTADGFATVRVNTGTITAVGNDSITLKRADGQSVTVPVTPDTKIRRDRAQAKLSDLKSGDVVRTMQVDRGSGFETYAIQARSAGAGSPDAKGSGAEPTAFD